MPCMHPAQRPIIIASYGTAHYTIALTFFYPLISLSYNFASYSLPTHYH